MSQYDPPTSPPPPSLHYIKIHACPAICCPGTENVNPRKWHRWNCHHVDHEGKQRMWKIASLTLITLALEESG
jgi:hypothetical protein